MLVVSVSSLKGGVGKTSVTLGLASAALNRGIPTLVVDMDPQADASTGLDVPVTTPVDIADVLSAPKSKIVDQAIFPSGWVDGSTGSLDVIPGSPRAAEFDRPSLNERYLKRLRTALQRHAAKYRLVLIDCPPSLNGLTRAAWTASHRVLVVTEPSLFSVAAADRALRAADEIRRRSAPDLQPLGIVVNRVRPSSREQSFRITELKDMFGPLVLNPPLAERTVLQQAQGSARPIHEWPGKPAAELAGAFDTILDRALRSESIRAARKAGTPKTNAAGDTAQAPQEKSAAAPRQRQDDSGAAQPGGQADSAAAGTQANSSATQGSAQAKPNDAAAQSGAPAGPDDTAAPASAAAADAQSKRSKDGKRPKAEQTEKKDKKDKSAKSHKPRH